MKKALRIFEQKDILAALEACGLVQQYKKAKEYLIRGYPMKVRFKERKPSGSGIWSFRINKQFRALGVFNDEGDLVIFEIDNHQ